MTAEKPKQQEAKQETKLEKVKIAQGEVSPEQMEEIEAGEYYTIAQVAKKLRYTGAWILELVKQGRIKAIQPSGSRWRIPHSEYERLIKGGIPPLPREKPKAPVTEIPVENKKIIDKVREPVKKAEPPGLPFPFSLFGTTTGGKK